MHKQHIGRTPLIAALGLLAFLVLPSVAQAHTTDSKAECVMVGNQATLRLNATFKTFTAAEQKTLKGKIWINGAEQFNGPVLADWSTNPGKWSWTHPADAGKPYTIETKWTWSTGSDGEKHSGLMCPAAPAIDLVKTGVATANSEETVTYQFAATNRGNVTLTNVVLTDDKCQSTLTRKAGETDASFDKGDVWNYTCTAKMPVGPASVTNVAEVCGTYMPPQGTPQTVCDKADHVVTVNPPTPITPLGTPPTGTTPVGTTGVLPETVASGLARMLGPSGCVKQAFRARVKGRSIASVAFFVDGRLVKRITGQRNTYAVKVKPQRYGFGRHRVIARVRFMASSGTPARTLPLTFRRCARQTVQPRLTA